MECWKFQVVNVELSNYKSIFLKDPTKGTDVETITLDGWAIVVFEIVTDKNDSPEPTDFILRENSEPTASQKKYEWRNYGPNGDFVDGLLITQEGRRLFVGSTNDIIDQSYKFDLKAETFPLADEYGDRFWIDPELIVRKRVPPIRGDKCEDFKTAVAEWIKVH